MTRNAYSRAVESFEALLAAPAAGGQDTPAALIKAAGLPASSGYRYVATLEAEGFFRRDESGTYLPGPATIRTGLRAHCLGRIAPAIQPILLQLRQATHTTAFLAISQDMTLRIGPHSIGRDTRQVDLQRTFSFESVPDFEIGTIVEIGLRTSRKGMSRRTSAYLHPVEITPDAILHIGLLSGPRRGDPRALTRPLALAGEKYHGASLDRP